MGLYLYYLLTNVDALGYRLHLRKVVTIAILPGTCPVSGSAAVIGPLQWRPPDSHATHEVPQPFLQVSLV